MKKKLSSFGLLLKLIEPWVNIPTTMEPAVKLESSSFPVINPIIQGFYISEYLGIEIKVLDPLTYDPANSDQYTENDIMINGSDICYKALHIEHPNWADSILKNEAKEAIKQWFRLDKTEKLLKAAEIAVKGWSVPHPPISVDKSGPKNEEDEEKLAHLEASEQVAQPPKKLGNTIKQVIMSGSKSIYGTYINKRLILDLIIYCSASFYFKVAEHLEYINSKALQLKQEGKAEELTEFRRIIGLKDLEIAGLKTKTTSAEASITSLTQQVGELTVDHEFMTSSDLDVPRRRDEAWLVSIITNIVKSRLVA